MPTKIAPTKAKPPHPITLIDTPDGRLVDGSKAVFTLDGVETVVDLRTNGKTGHGNLPAGMPGGIYTVAFRQPDGTVISAGSFEVDAAPEASLEPSISPTSGPVTTAFTISDPQGRMAGATVILFFETGQGPDQGKLVADAVFSADGKEATGTVPTTLGTGAHFVTVHATSSNDVPVFNALSFQVTL